MGSISAVFMWPHIYLVIVCSHISKELWEEGREFVLDMNKRGGYGGFAVWRRIDFQEKRSM